MEKPGSVRSLGSSRAGKLNPWPPTAGGARGTVSTAGRRNFNGLWASNWGAVNLIQEGSHVSGTFEGSHPGRLKGTVRGFKLTFSWRQRNGQAGRGIYRLSSDGTVIQGSWGVAESSNNGGPWLLRRVV